MTVSYLFELWSPLKRPISNPKLSDIRTISPLDPMIGRVVDVLADDRTPEEGQLPANTVFVNMLFLRHCHFVQVQLNEYNLLDASTLGIEKKG
jgi:hypothetical protein